MDLALNNLQRLIGHKTQQTNQPTKIIKQIFSSSYIFKSTFFNQSESWINYKHFYQISNLSKPYK